MSSPLPLTAAFGLALLTGVLLGGGARWLLGRRTHLGWAAAVLAGIFGAFLGTAAVNVVTDGAALHPLITLLAAVTGTVAVLLIATRLSAPPPPTPERLITAGESAQVEFKSTARFNSHTGQRDERLELVIAKTVSALANADGGHLFVGIDDDGVPLGLDGDLTLMKRPDIDRFELWLRDYLTQTIGAAATASLAVQFPEVSGTRVCWVQVPRAPRPVFLVPGKSAGPQMWVRVGNSTRQLPLDQALAYATDRWGRRARLARK